MRLPSLRFLCWVRWVAGTVAAVRFASGSGSDRVVVSEGPVVSGAASKLSSKRGFSVLWEEGGGRKVFDEVVDLEEFDASWSQ